MGFAYTSAPVSTQGTAFVSMDPPTRTSPKVQWVQTPLLTSEWIFELGLGNRKGNFCIIRGGHSWGPPSYCLATGTSWQQGWCWDKEHSVILGGATWSPLTLGAAGPMSYLPHT